MPNYYYMNDFPLTVAKGGKEEQQQMICGYIRAKFTDVFDIHDKTAPKIETGDTLHCFGDTPLFYYFSEFLKGNGIYPKLIISPSFYRKPAWIYRLMAFLPSWIPTWYTERKAMYKAFDRIIVNSEFEKIYLNRIFQLDNIEVIYNSFDAGTLRSVSTKSYAEEYCLCVSHVSERKNIFELLSAAEAFYKKTNIKLIIAGGVRFHSEDNLIKFEFELSKKKGVEFIGYQDKQSLSDLYANCRFHILPSFIETPGISNLEACSYGKPIIVGDFPVLHEYFGDSAIYCGFRSSEILKAMTIALTSTSPVEYDLSKFTTEVIAAKYSKVIDRLYD